MQDAGSQSRDPAILSLATRHQRTAPEANSKLHIGFPHHNNVQMASPVILVQGVRTTISTNPGGRAHANKSIGGLSSSAAGNVHNLSFTTIGGLATAQLFH